jgi:hypothetical protein
LKIERQVERMLAAGDSCGFVYCQWVIIDERDLVLDRSPDWQVEGRVFDALLRMNFTGNASVPLFRMHCLLEAGGYNPELAKHEAGGCEDWEVVLRVAAHYDVAVVPELLMGYRRREGSMSQACETMKRSHAAVIERLFSLRPDLTAEQVRQSNAHFAMHLAAVSLSAGHVREAVRWTLRAGVVLPLRLVPYVAKMVFVPHRTAPMVMRPGDPLDLSRIPPARVPYDQILAASSPRRLRTRAAGGTR